MEEKGSWSEISRRSSERMLVSVCIGIGSPVASWKKWKLGMEK
jgi:hypothetical protein